MREDNLLIAGFIAFGSAIMSLYNGFRGYQASRTRKVNRLLLLLYVIVCVWVLAVAVVLMDNAPACWQFLAASGLCIFCSVFWQFLIHIADRCGWTREQNMQLAATPAEIESKVRVRTAALELRNAALQQEIRESRAALAQIEYHANYDYLTGLPNRRRCYEQITQAVAGQDRALAVMFLDLDDFKLLNDGLGHACGDLALKQVAERIKALLCPAVTLARIGGDEFLILLHGGSGQEVAAAAETIANSIRQMFIYPFCFDNCERFLSVSTGIAIYPQHGLDADTLIKNADIAMYLAKNNGKNRYRFYSADREWNNVTNSWE
ncbi:diguanylate cyclase domain-containing protein [Sporomusa sp.]|uniref:diguanylate cyclase domain-containing protein n=1 Tax=Sporomusa sp. TaxID=2078658 RepID=UPI002CE64F90|nr:diguanylate cyclase [Sporomusa sp.]HWR05628.1 diguanylate cyclase [Sporomusa sp.]